MDTHHDLKGSCHYQRLKDDIDQVSSNSTTLDMSPSLSSMFPSSHSTKEIISNTYTYFTHGGRYNMVTHAACSCLKYVIASLVCFAIIFCIPWHLVSNGNGLYNATDCNTTSSSDARCTMEQASSWLVPPSHPWYYYILLCSCGASLLFGAASNFKTLKIAFQYHKVYSRTLLIKDEHLKNASWTCIAKVMASKVPHLFGYNGTDWRHITMSLCSDENYMLGLVNHRFLHNRLGLHLPIVGASSNPLQYWSTSYYGNFWISKLLAPVWSHDGDLASSIVRNGTMNSWHDTRRSNVSYSMQQLNSQVVDDSVHRTSRELSSMRWIMCLLSLIACPFYIMAIIVRFISESIFSAKISSFAGMGATDNEWTPFAYRLLSCYDEAYCDLAERMCHASKHMSRLQILLTTRRHQPFAVFVKQIVQFVLVIMIVVTFVDDRFIAMRILPSHVLAEIKWFPSPIALMGWMVAIIAMLQSSLNISAKSSFQRRRQVEETVRRLEKYVSMPCKPYFERNDEMSPSLLWGKDKHIMNSSTMSHTVDDISHRFDMMTSICNELFQPRWLILCREIMSCIATPIGLMAINKRSIEEIVAFIVMNSRQIAPSMGIKYMLSGCDQWTANGQERSSNIVHWFNTEVKIHNDDIATPFEFISLVDEDDHEADNDEEGSLASPNAKSSPRFLDGRDVDDTKICQSETSQDDNQGHDSKWMESQLRFVDKEGQCLSYTAQIPRA